MTDYWRAESTTLSEDIFNEITDHIDQVFHNNKEELSKLCNNYIIYFNQSNAPLDETNDSEICDGIEYSSFVNTMELPSIIGGDDIVIKMSYINIYFDFPCVKDQPTFKITADNDELGFTRKELALKILQLFHMLYFLHKNYDMEKGIISDDITNKCFQPLIAEYDYESNSIYGIEHNGDNIWKVLLVYIH